MFWRLITGITFLAYSLLQGCNFPNNKSIDQVQSDAAVLSPTQLPPNAQSTLDKMVENGRLTDTAIYEEKSTPIPITPIPTGDQIVPTQPATPIPKNKENVIYVLGDSGEPDKLNLVVPILQQDIRE